MNELTTREVRQVCSWGRFAEQQMRLANRPPSDEHRQLLAKLEQAAGSVAVPLLPAPTGTVRAFEYITVGEAAKRLGIGARAVRKRIAAGTLPAQRLGGRKWRIEWRP